MIKIHFQQKWHLFTACGVYSRGFLDGCKVTNRRKRVTCKNCKRTKLFRKIRNLLKAPKG